MIIKCKMCGGDLNILDDNPVCECEFCGTQQTVPVIDDEKKANLFNRANKLRMNADYDKAATVYASITAEFPEEAEAYWGLCLCKYGIEYVDDPATEKKIPTCHRTLPESIMDDSDFDQACENADPVAMRLYREEAKEIDRIQRAILDIVATEPPYDVFICYKETDENGERTEDSVLAQDIYDSLTAKELRVFFARISLEDKLGKEYEPYIYAALHSSKVMLAIGTKFEYYAAVWVKNEWARFLDMMKNDRTKSLIPCYKDLDAYDMPREFKNLQAQDMGKLGWLQDLTRGVCKLCGKDKESKTQVSETIIQPSNPTADSLLRRAFVFLEDGKWEEAKNYAEKVLDIDVGSGMAYLAKLLADLKCSKEEYLKDLSDDFTNYENYQKIIRFGSEELKNRISEYNNNIVKRNNDLLEGVKKLEREYLSAASSYAERKKKAENTEEELRKLDYSIQHKENEIFSLQKERDGLKKLFDGKKREALDSKIAAATNEVKELKEKVEKIEAERKENTDCQEELIPPDKTWYYYSLAILYYKNKKYKKAYEYCDQIRGYRDVNDMIEKMSKIIPGVIVDPGFNMIIEKIKMCRSAREMIEKLESSGLPENGPAYMRVMEELKKRVQIERMYGVSHESTMNTLNKLINI